MLIEKGQFIFPKSSFARKILTLQLYRFLYIPLTKELGYKKGYDSN